MDTRTNFRLDIILEDCGYCHIDKLIRAAIKQPIESMGAPVEMINLGGMYNGRAAVAALEEKGYRPATLAELIAADLLGNHDRVPLVALTPLEFRDSMLNDAYRNIVPIIEYSLDGQGYLFTAHFNAQWNEKWLHAAVPLRN